MLQPAHFLTIQNEREVYMHSKAILKPVPVYEGKRQNCFQLRVILMTRVKRIDHVSFIGNIIFMTIPLLNKKNKKAVL